MLSRRHSCGEFGVYRAKISGFAFPLPWAMLFLLCTGLSASPTLAVAQVEALPVSERDREATMELIRLTEGASALCSNFAEILTDPPKVESRLDDVLLLDELRRRSCSAEWPQNQCYEGLSWRESLPTAQLQILCWLAECNKRMCFGTPDTREKNRHALMEVLATSLQNAKDPIQTRGILDIAYRTVFYRAPVIPVSTSDGLIELFKQYVGSSDIAVHEFARERLRWMGYVVRNRYDEIRSVLIEKAPEIKDCITTKPLPGITVDPLTGTDIRTGTVKEEDWLALDTMPPAALAGLVQVRVTSERSQDVYGYQALNKLIYDSTSRQSDTAFALVLDLAKKGIATSNTLYAFALCAAEEHDQAKNERLHGCLEELIRVLPEASKSTWPMEKREPTEVIQNVLTAIKEDSAQKTDNGHSSTGAYVRVERRLEAELGKLGASAK